MTARDRLRLAAATLGGLLSQRLRAEQRLPRIGLVSAGRRDPRNHLIAAFHQGMREQGLEEGRHYLLEVRWADGVIAAIPTLTAELTALPVDVILAGNNVNTAAARTLTSTIPVVMVLGVEPVKAGFIDSFSRPGRNITGLTNAHGADIDGKMLALLKELLPHLRTVGVLVQEGVRADEASANVAARELQLRLHNPVAVQRPEDIEAAFQEMQRAGVQAVYVVGGALIYGLRQRVVELALQYKLPALYFSSDYVRAGGLISYGTDLRAQYMRAAWYVSRILSGARPAEMPVELPARFETAINLKTAKALGISVPTRVMLQVSEVVQ